MSNIIEIGSAKAKPGEIVEGNIFVEKLAGGSDLTIPVTIINGAKPGPCFWINGGIHGDEPEGILTCSLLKEKIKPDDLSGSIVMIPVMNVPAMEAAERGNPLDTFSYDMNRIYPGRKEGYLSERIAHIHKEWMIKYADMEILFIQEALILILQKLCLQPKMIKHKNLQEQWVKIGKYVCILI